jgi:tetratricopeptide (TPR) repeat protein
MGMSLFMASLRDAEGLERAVTLLEQAVTDNPRNDRYKVDLADAYMYLNNELSVALAIDWYLDVLSRDGRNDALLARIAEAYARLGNYDTAFEYAGMRLKAGTDSAYPAALQMALLALDSRDYPRGIAELQRLLGQRPNEQAARLLLAAVEEQAGDKAKALALVQQVISAAPKDAPLAAQAQQMKERIAR